MLKLDWLSWPTFSSLQTPEAAPTDLLASLLFQLSARSDAASYLSRVYLDNDGGAQAAFRRRTLSMSDRHAYVPGRPHIHLIVLADEFP